MKYLENVFRDTLKLVGTPIKIDFKRTNNPFSEKKNKLTPSQQKRRDKMIKSSRQARTRRARERGKPKF